MYKNQDTEIWDALIKLAEAGKALAQGKFGSSEVREETMRTLYRMCHRIQKEFDSQVILAYDWGIINRNITLDVKITTGEDVRHKEDVNLLVQRAGQNNLAAQLHGLGFTNEEIDNFLE